MIKNYTDYLSEVHDQINRIRREARRQIAQLQNNALKYTLETFTFLGWNKFWSKSQLTSDGQFERFEQSVSDTSLNVVSLDEKARSGIIDDSSGSFEVSGEKCGCGDFVFRGLPCKHIYYLANALIDENNEMNVKSAL